MANRYPLVLDTTDGNKIKELPEDDNLILRNNNIVDVLNITSLGTISAQDILVAGQKVLPQSLVDLTDTPSTYEGNANKILKVSSDETTLDFVDLSAIGDITAGNILIEGDLYPDGNNEGSVGVPGQQFLAVRAKDVYANIRGRDGTLLIDADNNQIPYAAVVGGPTALSEFANDTNYVTQAEVDASLAAGITISDFKGSVFGDDSTLIIDGTNSTINPATISGTFGGPIATTELTVDAVSGGSVLLLTTEGNSFGELIRIAPDGANNDIILDATSISLVGTVIEPIVTSNNVTVGGELAVTGNLTVSGNTVGDFVGSVSYDDSTVIIDGNNKKIVSPDIVGNATFENDIVVQGNLTVQGTTTSVETTNTTIKDNTIVLNDGELGAGVTNLSAGIEIDRGSEANVSFIWDEGIDRWSIGAQDFTASGLYSTSITGAGTGNITGYGNVTGTGAGTISGFATITGQGGGNITQFASITGTSGGTISQFTNITGDSGGTISQFTNITGDSGGTISQFTNITGDSGGDITQFTNITGDSGGDITQFTNITGDSGGTISQFTNITGDSGGTISGFTTLTGDSAGDITGFVNVTGTNAGDLTGFVNVTGTGAGTISGFDLSGNLTGDAAGNHTGTFTGSITATGTLDGDVTGSVFADDSTTIIDATDKRIYGTFVGNIIGDIEGDPILTIQTPFENTGEIINLTTGSGQAGFVNITSDTFRHFGDSIDFEAATTFDVGTASTTDFTVNGNNYTKVLDGKLDVTAAGASGYIAKATAGTLNLQSGIDATDANIQISGSGGNAGNGTFVVTATNYSIIDSPSLEIYGTVTADAFKGSVFADDSTVLVDAVNGEIPGYVKIADLKTALQDGAGDYAAFKAWVLANL